MSGPPPGAAPGRDWNEPGTTRQVAWGQARSHRLNEEAKVSSLRGGDVRPCELWLPSLPQPLPQPVRVRGQCLCVTAGVGGAP